MYSRRIFVLLALLAGCRGDPTTVLDRLHEARQVTAEARHHFSEARDASNRAVMAGTDEGAQASAREAAEADKRLERDRARLERLLSSLAYSRELRTLQDFSADLAVYRALDQRILQLATANTNLKAQSVAFGPAAQAATDFRKHAAAAMPALPAKQRTAARLLVDEAIAAVLEMQVLHAPHIAARDEAAMQPIEQQLALLDQNAHRALTSTLELATSTPAAKTELDAALEALTRFDAASKSIIELSRRNTNVIALDLTLREKPGLASACSDQLRNLQESLANEGPKSLR